MLCIHSSRIKIPFFFALHFYIFLYLSFINIFGFILSSFKLPNNKFFLKFPRGTSTPFLIPGFLEFTTWKIEARWMNVTFAFVTTSCFHCNGIYNQVISVVEVYIWFRASAAAKDLVMPMMPISQRRKPILIYNITWQEKAYYQPKYRR